MKVDVEEVKKNERTRKNPLRADDSAQNCVEAESVRAKFVRCGNFFKSHVAVALLAVFSVAILVWILPKLPQKPATSAQKHYRGVLELWNVEGFEGGYGSRQGWLTARAAQFEKKNSGLFVHVTTLSEQQFAEKSANGDAFDIICFSRGVGSAVQNLLQPYSGSVADIRENLLSSGELGGGVLALPVYAGVYCLFARESQLPQNADLKSVALTATFTKKIGKKTYVLAPLICGFSAYICPVSALSASGAKGSFSPDESLSQYDAYERFVVGKTAVTLLGTQRDLYRLGKREEAGKIEKLAFAALDGYTDLVQYAAVSKTAGDKTCSAVQFLQYLVSEASQQTLTDVGMFSALEKSFYTSERYLACEQALSVAWVPNVFADKSAIVAQRQAAIDDCNST